jgi:hypothetical protein
MSRPVSPEVQSLVELLAAVRGQVAVRRAQQPRLPDAEVLDAIAERVGPLVDELEAVVARHPGAPFAPAAGGGRETEVYLGLRCERVELRLVGSGAPAAAGKEVA